MQTQVLGAQTNASVACDAAKGAADSATELKGELAEMSGLGFPSLDYIEEMQAVSSALIVGDLMQDPISLDSGVESNGGVVEPSRFEVVLPDSIDDTLDERESRWRSGTNVSGPMFPRCSRDAAMLNVAEASTDSATGSKGVLVQESGIDVESPGYSKDSQLVSSPAALTHVIQASADIGIVLEDDSAKSAPARELSLVAGAAALSSMLAVPAERVGLRLVPAASATSLPRPVGEAAPVVPRKSALRKPSVQRGLTAVAPVEGAGEVPKVVPAGARASFASTDVALEAGLVKGKKRSRSGSSSRSRSCSRTGGENLKGGN